MRSRKFACGQSRLTVASKNSIRNPRLLSSKLWASSITIRAIGRSTFLLRMTSESFSGVATRTWNGCSSSFKRSSSKASISTAAVSCSTCMPIGSKSCRSRLVSCAHKARVGATYATHPLSASNWFRAWRMRNWARRVFPPDVGKSTTIAVFA